MIVFDAILIAFAVLGSYLAFRTPAYIRSGRLAVAALCGLGSVTIAALLINCLPAFPGIRTVWTQRRQRTEDCASRLATAKTWVDYRGEESAATAHCSTQIVVNHAGRSAGAPDAQREVSLAECSNAGRRAPDDWLYCYGLGFLEFDQRGRLLEPLQAERLAALAERLRAGYAPGTRPPADGVRSGVYTIYYVHGWRHDARPRDSDVRRLRVLASNAATNLAERCRRTGEWCNTPVIAVFVSWPGAVGLWDTGNCSAPGSACRVRSMAAELLNALTFPSRKALSDRLGPAIAGELVKLDERIRQAFPGQVAHSLLLGHSLGGNLLLSAAADNLTRNGDRGIARDGARPFLGLPGDLNVLLNPATEVGKWKYVFDRARDAEKWDGFTAPRLIAIATSALPNPALDSDQDLLYDNVVGTYFRISQSVVGLVDRGSMDRDAFKTGFGHDLDKANGQKYDVYTNFAQLNTSMNGTLPATNADYTRYERIGTPLNTCLPQTGLLYCARNKGPGNASCRTAPDAMPAKHSWDFLALDGQSLGLVRHVPSATGRRLQQISVQFGTGIAPGSGQRAVGFGPVWGVIANQSLVLQHGGIASAPLHCMLNAFVLDQPMRRANPRSALPGPVADPEYSRFLP